MAAQVIDGKAIAAKVRQRIGEKVAELKARGITPGLAVVLVGSDPASKVYVGMKKKNCIELGMYSADHELPESTSETELLNLIKQSITSASTNKEMALKFLQFRASPEGQILTAIKPSYAASMPSKAAWKKLDEEQPVWAEKLQHQLDKRNVMDEIKEGKIEIRGIPTQQSIEEWTQAWTEFKNL